MVFRAAVIARLCGIGVCRTDGTGRSLRVRDDAKRRERPCDLLAQLRHARLLVRIVGCQCGQLIDTLPSGAFRSIERLERGRMPQRL